MANHKSAKAASRKRLNVTVSSAARPRTMFSFRVTLVISQKIAIESINMCKAKLVIVKCPNIIEPPTARKPRSVIIRHNIKTLMSCTIAVLDTIHVDKSMLSLNSLWALT